MIDGVHHYYDTREVLPVLYEQQKETKQNDLERERARLAARQADRTELIIQQMKKELIPSSLLSEALSKTFTSIRAKLISLPSKSAPQITGLETLEIEAFLKDLIYETLEELASFSLATIDARDSVGDDPEESFSTFTTT